MTFRIADTFSDALAKLSGQEQKAAKTAAFDAQMNPDNPGLQMHRVDRARDPHFWTARVNRDIRLVLHKKGGATLLAWVGHHDDAYAWAERRRIDVHPRTGAAQIVEIRETVEDVIIQRYVEEAVKKPRLFAEEDDETLLSWGVPEDWLDTVREATEDTVLDIASHLPQEAGEALLQAATGERPTPAPRAEDPYEHPDAARRFRLTTTEADLAAALEAPWEKWTVWLHPAQKEFVDRNFNGPARVIGSAGTGKTVVALHRAARLARENTDAHVLLTTFNQRLADGLSAKLPMLLPDKAVRDRITTSVLGALAHDLYAKVFGSIDEATPDDVAEALTKAAADADVKVDQGFLEDEWRLVVDAWAVADRDAYRDLPRLGRLTRMAASRRDALWDVFAATRAALKGQGKRTRAQMLHALAAHYRGGASRPFTHAVVDEAQDISVPELHFLAALAGDRPNGLFFAGDIGQRIFRAPFPWKAAGVDVRGRSRSLKVNYRTSQQIRSQSDRLLPVSLTEADGNEDRRTGVVSLFDGPPPEITEFPDADAEIKAVAAWLADLAAIDVTGSEVALLVRSEDEIPRAKAAKELFLTLTSREVEPEVRVMHDAKGAEYRAVAVMACDEDVIPKEDRLLEARDEAMIEEIMATERHLLYVAATRARERLWVSGAGRVSEFLEDLI
ncbi:3'-5' exonuclease [Frigidibacter sp. ROC022]|uniref:3'-5' exonuclease n=1 Tax=Frigidibacter sp. ROC022 TaxID=2971796 RepID=UPI00215AE109|nr:3'-5' exonuclease [Frigidibacter sp. ROC022]MCR8726467.1 AAA family ATPase [Frigidibacter sp. ROC022]